MSKFKVLKVDHIGIAVNNIEEAKKIYADMLGMEVKGVEVVEEQKVKACFIPCGESKIELLESTSPDGPIGKYIEKNGEGIQHIAFQVDDIEAALADLKEKGVRLIDEKPRHGAGGNLIAFLHPKGTNGVLLEICMKKK